MKMLALLFVFSIAPAFAEKPAPKQAVTAPPAGAKPVKLASADAKGKAYDLVRVDGQIQDIYEKAMEKMKAAQKALVEKSEADFKEAVKALRDQQSALTKGLEIPDGYTHDWFGGDLYYFKPPAKTAVVENRAQR